MGELSVPVTKGKASMNIDTDAIPAHVYEAALALGLKELLNKGQSKVTAALYPDVEERKAAAMAISEKNLAAMLDGTIKIPGQKAAASGKESGVVMTEARRIARNMVKDAIRANGDKPSLVDAKDITIAANALLVQDPSIIETAKANLAERAKVPVSLDIIKAIPISAKKVKAAEAKKVKDQLSAKQAGKVKVRAKGGEATAH